MLIVNFLDRLLTSHTCIQIGVTSGECLMLIPPEEALIGRFSRREQKVGPSRNPSTVQ